MSKAENRQLEGGGNDNGQNSDTSSPGAGGEEHDGDLIRYQEWLRELLNRVKSGNT